MKVPQITTLLVLLAGIGIVAMKRGGVRDVPFPPVEAAATEPVPVAAADSQPPERPVFRSPHDGSHVYQGIRCPACVMEPMEF